MRRNSPKAIALLEILKEKGVMLNGQRPTGRLLERLSQDGLLDDGEDGDVMVRRIEELAALGYGMGKSADRTALVMLTRGLPCRRARPAMLRGLGLKAEALLAGTFDPDAILPILKEGMTAERLDIGDFVAEAAEGMYESPKQSPAERWALGWLDSISTPSDSGRFDYAGAMIAPPGEPAEEHRESHLRAAMEAFLGGEVTDTCLWGEMHQQFGTHGKDASAEMSYDEDDQARKWFAIVGDVLPRTLKLAVDAPLPMLVVAAQMVRPALRRSARFDDEDADCLAACLAPMVLAVLESGARLGIEGLASMAAGLIGGMIGAEAEPTTGNGTG